MDVLRKIRCILLLFILLVLGEPLLADPNRALLIEMNQVVGPASIDYLQRALDYAQKSKTRLIVMKLNPQGSLDSSLQDFLKIIIESPVPIVSYIYPSGVKAESAATFILYASHIAAMAQATSLSAPIPIRLNNFSNQAVFSENHENSLDKNTMVSNEQEAKQKIIQEVMNYFKNTAELRGRNSQWAQQSILNGSPLFAQEALKLNVIDIIAKDIPDLLKKLDGKLVSIDQKTIVIQSQDLGIKNFSQGFRSNFLSTITNPTMAYVLLILAFYGLLFEFLSPGYILPGILGSLSLIVALYALYILPINTAGLLLLIFGIVFMIAELFISSFGVLGLGGVIAFILGSMMLIDGHDPIFKVNHAVIFIISFINIAFIYGLIRMVIKSRFQKPHTGQEAIVGQIGTANFDFLKDGEVHVVSENWRAKTLVPIYKGQSIKITKVEGLTVWIEPV